MKLFRWILLLLGLSMLMFVSACTSADNTKNNQNIEIPTTITWNNMKYTGTNEPVKDVGKQVGTDEQGRKVFEDPSSPDNKKIILIFGDLKQKYELSK